MNESLTKWKQLYMQVQVLVSSIPYKIKHADIKVISFKPCNNSISQISNYSKQVFYSIGPIKQIQRNRWNTLVLHRLLSNFRSLCLLRMVAYCYRTSYPDKLFNVAENSIYFLSCSCMSFSLFPCGYVEEFMQM